MKNTDVKKRGWAKNALIVFLIALLILIVFSNTIMNRSLPEVATQHPESGTITARVRGSGEVRANESFNVEVGHTRTVDAVHVRLYDEVDIGDVLITLAGDGSEELDRVKAELRSRELDLERELLELTRPDGTLAMASVRVQRARNDLTAAEAARARISYSEAAYNAAQAAHNNAQAELRSAEAAQAATSYTLAVARAELAALDRIIYDGGTVDPIEYDQAVQNYNTASFADDLAQATLGAADTAARLAGTDYDTQSRNRGEWIAANDEVRIAQQTLTDLVAEYALDQARAGFETAVNDFAIREIMQDIEDLQAEIEEMEQDETGSEIVSRVGGIVTAVNISPGNQTEPDIPLLIIEVVDRGYSLSFSVTAEQANRVTLGSQAEVSRDFWSPNELPVATLTNIRPDPENPVAGRMLDFTITGDVESGMNLNLVLNQRSENFSTIVPNSAIRSDTNGTFVLVIMSRQTPLGNRYTATRVDVTVLATDDTNSAVIGELSTFDFVITTATSPVEPGMQIRLVDNP